MNRHTRDTIELCAAQVRIWAEYKARGDTLLSGWCGICSAELWHLLHDFGIKCRLRISMKPFGSHIYLVVDDYIVDVTATQFAKYRSKTLLIMHEREADQWYHGSQGADTDCFNTPEELRLLQKRWRWPASQIVFKSRQVEPLVA